ncbi:MAG: RNB domain-containing ribonuclease [Bacilli bacterium]|nr:RNB domain-containing ribonuclease [Bacilli bacterium]
MGDFGYILKIKKSKNYILKTFGNEEKFLTNIINYITDLVNKHYTFSDDEINNICTYISYFICSDEILEQLNDLCKRLSEIKRSLDKKQKTIYTILETKIEDVLIIANYDANNKKKELKDLEKSIDEIIENNNPVIFEIINESKISKFKYHDGQLLIDKILKKFTTLLQNQIFYKETLEYLKQIIFIILSNNTKSNKIDKVITELEKTKKCLHSKQQNEILMSLKNELYLLKDGKLPGKTKQQSSEIIEKYYGINTNYSKETQQECENLKSTRYNGIKKIGNYEFYEETIKDYRNKQIITIDQHFKTAYDDAISIEKTDYGYLLGIYIADVASFIDVNSNLGISAKQKCESIYLSENNRGSITMFPEKITREFFSLNSNSDKQVVAYLFEFSDDFDLIKCEFTNAIININNNYTFNEIDNIDPSDTNYDMIYNLIKITDNLKKHYNQNYHQIKEKIKKTKIVGTGANITSTSSIFLNSYIASLFKKRKWPLIYRVNETNLNDNITNLNLEKIAKTYSKSYYSANPDNHIITNGPYCHITNPIRNYPSFINQYLFERLCLDTTSLIDSIKFINYWNEILPNLVEQINKKMDMNNNYIKVMKNIKK